MLLNKILTEVQKKKKKQTKCYSNNVKEDSIVFRALKSLKSTYIYYNTSLTVLKINNFSLP